jgi:transcriptional regulator with XRE-family HTH domain
MAAHPDLRYHRRMKSGELLRGWRERRRLSQLELALAADVSPRHLSFVETGRANPSRSLVLALADELDLPLRERNAVLLAAGFAPVFAETPLDAPHMVAARAALRQLLVAHEPYPALVIDRHWNLVDANASVATFLTNVAPALLEPPVNVLRVSLHPGGTAPDIVNLGEWRAHLLGRLRRQVASSADPVLAALYAELTAYPCARAEPVFEPGSAAEIVVPLRFRHPEGERAYFSIVASFGTPLDITLAELAIESFFPAG